MNASPHPHRARPPKDLTFLIVLLGLAALTAALWFADPSHAGPEKSRINWPAPASGQKP